MATYYVGPGGNDGNSGLSWALRKLTLNGAEDVPVVAGDVVYVAPGVYRELLTVDVSGSGGSPITYIADVTGANTDGVGGIVRITGSNNDQTVTRAYGFYDNWGSKNYRTFRGFTVDLVSAAGSLLSGTNWIIEDCVFSDTITGVYITGANQNAATIRRCIFTLFGVWQPAVYTVYSSTLSNITHVVENCLFFGSNGYGVAIDRVGGGTIRNCTFLGLNKGIVVQQALAGGQSWTVNNSIVSRCITGLQATVLGEIVENYNAVFGNSTPRTLVNTGANSNAYPPLLLPPVLHSGASQASGYKFPWWFGELSQWSQVRAITGTSEPAVDMYGIPRPATAAKNSWGPVQYQPYAIETGTVQAGSKARALTDAGSKLVRRFPVTAVSTTVTLYVRRETNYAGSVPRMIIKQPGQADRTTDMTAAVDTWEQLSDTFTPAASPPYVEVWIQSRNTAVAGSYKVIYDTMDVA